MSLSLADRLAARRLLAALHARRAVVGAERDGFQQSAERQLAAYGGALSELDRLIALHAPVSTSKPKESA